MSLSVVLKRKLKHLLKTVHLHDTVWKLRHRMRLYHLSRSDKQRLAFYRSFIQPGDTVFDVGANMGNRSVIFLALKAKTVAVEPQPTCADFLDKLLGNRPQFHLERMALGSQPGEADMFISEESPISTLSESWVQANQTNGRFSHYKWRDKQKVPLSTLDELIARHGCPSFVKIDVEGFELEVLRGLSQPLQAVSLEFNNEFLDLACDCVDRLQTLGNYEFQLSLGESMRFLLPAWRDAAALKNKLRELAAENPDGWGDIYARQPTQAAHQ